MNCIVHPERPATGTLNVPCAPGGKLHVCDDCAKPENIGAVFDAYKSGHGKEIKVYKQVNPGS